VHFVFKLAFPKALICSDTQLHVVWMVKNTPRVDKGNRNKRVIQEHNNNQTKPIMMTPSISNPKKNTKKGKQKQRPTPCFFDKKQPLLNCQSQLGGGFRYLQNFHPYLGK